MELHRYPKLNPPDQLICRTSRSSEQCAHRFGMRKNNCPVCSRYGRRRDVITPVRDREADIVTSKHGTRSRLPPPPSRVHENR